MTSIERMALAMLCGLPMARSDGGIARSSGIQNGDVPAQISSPFIEIHNLGGYCPVQGEGAIDDQEFYFRARGRYCAIGIGGDDVVMKPTWLYWEQYGDGDFAAGYMPLGEARAFIDKAVALYRAGEPTMEWW